jgi:hypothetical protein
VGSRIRGLMEENKKKMGLRCFVPTLSVPVYVSEKRTYSSTIILDHQAFLAGRSDTYFESDG